MPDFASMPPLAAYVVAAYVASGVGIAGIVIDTLLRARRWRARAENRDRNAPR